MLGFIIGAFMCAYSQRVVKKRFVEALAKMRGRKGDQSAQPTKLSWLESRKLKMGKDREQQEVLPLADEFKKLFSMHAPKWTSCLLYTSPSPRDLSTSRMPSSA